VIGAYGLDFPQGTWTWSGGSNKARTSSVSYGDPNSSLTVNYTNDAGDANFPANFSWSESQTIRVNIPSGMYVRVIWPGTLAVNVNSTTTGPCTSGTARTYWQTMTFDQQLLASSGSVVTSGDDTQNPCGSACSRLFADQFQFLFLLDPTPNQVGPVHSKSFVQ